MLNKTLSQSQIEFNKYLKQMGMREYQDGTVVYYEDEYDKQMLEMNLSNVTGHSKELMIDYDIDLINELFDPENKIRISNESKFNNFENQNLSAIESQTHAERKPKESINIMDFSHDLDFLGEENVNFKSDHLFEYDEDLYDENLMQSTVGHPSTAGAKKGRMSLINQAAIKQTIKATTKRIATKKNEYEYFTSIVRKNQKLSQGSGVQAAIYKKISGAKKMVVGPDSTDYSNIGRTLYYGNIKKQKGKLTNQMHPRWVVMRGWQLYWYRDAGDTEQKGILTLPSQQIVVKEGQKKISFNLPKEEAKEGIKVAGNRAMSFGDDFSTRVFRNFVDFMIKYKIYAEHIQKTKSLMEVPIERFFKVDQESLR